MLLIGASLSEPHTSVTALRTCVCMYVCMSVCGHIPKILNKRVWTHSKLLYEINRCIIELIFHKLPLEESVLDWTQLIIDWLLYNHLISEKILHLIIQSKFNDKYEPNHVTNHTQYFAIDFPIQKFVLYFTFLIWISKQWRQTWYNKHE